MIRRWWLNFLLDAPGLTTSCNCHLVGKLPLKISSFCFRHCWPWYLHSILPHPASHLEMWIKGGIQIRSHSADGPPQGPMEWRWVVFLLFFFFFPWHSSCCHYIRWDILAAILLVLSCCSFCRSLVSLWDQVPDGSAVLPKWIFWQFAAYLQTLSPSLFQYPTSAVSALL